jgi:hypothetical protein
MPNIRIALVISQFGCQLYSLGLNQAGIEPMAENADATDKPALPATPASAPERKPLPPAAQRALAEAEARRQAAAANATPTARESGGQKGPEPTRYGDWENKGLASDF